MREITLTFLLSIFPHFQKMRFHNADTFIFRQEGVGDTAQSGIAELGFLFGREFGVAGNVGVVRMGDVAII